MNKSILKFFFLAAIFGSLFMTSCDDKVEEPDPVNEEELITTVELSFTPTGGDAVVFRFADPDGDGGNAPTEIDTITLAPDTMYTLAVRFLDESDASDVEDITEEVLEEAEEHLVCYTTDAGTTVSITDTDNGGLALGLAADVATTAAGSGTFSISLKHQPDVKDGTCAPGETDVEVDFPLIIQ